MGSPSGHGQRNSAGDRVSYLNRTPSARLRADPPDRAPTHSAPALSPNSQTKSLDAAQASVLCLGRFMLYRKLGKTGWKVSVLSLGGSSIGGAFGQLTEKEGIRVVRAALDQGVNFFNAAPYYGFAKSEVLLGKALKGVLRQ